MTAGPFLADLKRSLRSGFPGEALPNSAYRFNPPGADRKPFRAGYEAETREIARLAGEGGASVTPED